MELSTQFVIYAFMAVEHSKRVWVRGQWDSVEPFYRLARNRDVISGETVQAETV